MIAKAMPWRYGTSTDPSVSQLRIYIDEDAMDTDLVAAFRSRGVFVVTVSDTGSAGQSDSAQLTLATREQCVLYTFNVADFYRLHTEWLRDGRGHGGMILAPQQRYTTGEQLRRLLWIRASMRPKDMLDHVEFLSNWN
jgi:hypothetical protein